MNMVLIGKVLIPIQIIACYSSQVINLNKVALTSLTILINLLGDITVLT